jgi:hypothetical protein
MMKSKNFSKEEKSNSLNTDKTKKERLSEALRSNLKKRKVFQKKQNEGINS